MANPSAVSGAMLARAMQTQRLHFTRRAIWEKADWGRSAIGASCQHGGYHTTKANTMRLQSILNRIQKQRGFVYDRAEFVERGGKLRIVVTVRERQGSKPVCSGCGCKRPAYDRVRQRLFQFVPLWAIAVYLAYAPRRCNCPRCGVRVELLPWADGKQQMTTAFVWFLANWAKVLSWKETAARFHVSWQTVHSAVEIAVTWGRLHQNLDGIRSIGVDELSWSVGHKYLTLVYQIDNHCRRLLWIGRDRTAEAFNGFFEWLGEDRCKQLSFVVSDMWKAFLSTVAKRANQAIHVLDRFHIMRLFSEAIDQVRRDEARKLRAEGDTVTLKHTRWVLLKRKEHLSGKQFARLAELMMANTNTLRGYLLKEQFQDFWGYKSTTWADKFLDHWLKQALGTRLEPFRRLAKTLHDHRGLLLNWLRAREEFAAGAVEGFNLKARVTTRLAYGFRSHDHAEIALYHRLGNLPEPDWLTHRFT